MPGDQLKGGQSSTKASQRSLSIEFTIMYTRRKRAGACDRADIAYVERSRLYTYRFLVAPEPGSLAIDLSWENFTISHLIALSIIMASPLPYPTPAA